MFDNLYNFYNNFKLVKQEENQMKMRRKNKNKYYKLMLITKSVKITQKPIN